MSIGVSVSDLPKGFRPPIIIGTLLALGGVIVIGLGTWARAEARDQAATTTRMVLAEDLESFKKAAKESASTAAREGAREGSEKVIREVIAPLGRDVRELTDIVTAHVARDDQRQQATDDAIRDLKIRSR